MTASSSHMRRRSRWRSDSAYIGALAVPLVLTQFAQVALSTTDVVMMGLLGPLEIAAGGLGLAVFNLLRTMGVGLITPVANLVAVASADDRHGESAIRDLVRASLAVATLAGCALWCLMPCVGPLLLWLGQDAEVVARTADYLFAAAPGVLPLLWFQVLRNLTVGLRRPGPLLGITLASVAVNAVLNYALMYGRFGLPALGLTGIGWSTTLVNAGAFVAFLVIVRRDPALARLLSIGFRRPGWPALSRIWKPGLPVAATYGSEAGFFAVVSLLAGAIGAEALAAHTVVNQAVYIVFMISVGLSHATSVSISKAWAAGDMEAACRLGRTGLGLGAGCMAIVAVPYLAWPQLVLSLFLQGDGAGETGMLAVAGQLLVIAALLQFFDCGQNIGIGMLRGAGETRSAFAITLVGYWGIGLPIAWLLGHVAGAGARGIWIGLTAGLLATAVLLLLRFRKLVGARSAAPAAPAAGEPAASP